MTPRSSRRYRCWFTALAALWALFGWLFVAPDETSTLAVGGDSSPPPAFDRSVKAVLEARCYECHDAQTKAGDLDLITLAADYTDPATFVTWVRIHDRVRDGEMPPADAQRLAADERAGLLQFLDENLRAADAARQAREGRALARRLNREEYQHTLRDLLGIEEDYRGLLPEDGSAFGFDKVGSALSISPEHLEAYLAAAEAALGEAIVTGPAPPVTHRKIPQRLSGFTVTSFRNRFAHMFVDEPNALVRFTDFVDGVLGFRAQATGDFRFRIRAYAWHTDNKPIRARIRAGYPGDNAGGARWLVGYEQFPPEGATVEVTVRLHPGETLRVGPYAVGSKEARFRDRPGRFGYQGPGLAIEWVEVEGPLYDAWPPAGHRRLLGQLDFVTATRTDAQRVMRDFLPRAFRRPVLDDEVQHYLALYDQAAAERGFQSGIKTALKAALCSPHFLFLHAPPGALDEPALAARLSYFLWSSMPDDELSVVATRGELRQPAMLRRQVERMLRDPKSAAFTESFTGQWLDLRKIAATSPDATLYPEFDEFLQ
ncbi:MAG TPA: DUF1592 domain-containing protein, partial [Pirellulales bacterium]|nr:DUF1592 domain-containing protein [Pirellulales bacterium]